MDPQVTGGESCSLTQFELITIKDSFTAVIISHQILSGVWQRVRSSSEKVL